MSDSIQLLSIVVPCFNEEDNVSRFIDELKRCMNLCQILHWEAVLVDDGSQDQTSEMIKLAQKEDSRIKTVRLPKNKGYGQALLTGFKESKGDWIFVTDVDLQFHLEDFQKLLPFVGTHNFIQGFRIKRCDSFFRVALGSVFRKMVRFLFAVPVKDPECSFRLFRSDLVCSIEFQSNGALVPVEFIFKANLNGARFKDIGVRHRERAEGSSKALNLKSFLKLSSELVFLILSSKLPIKKENT